MKRQRDGAVCQAERIIGRMGCGEEERCRLRERVKARDEEMRVPLVGR